MTLTHRSKGNDNSAMSGHDFSAAIAAGQKVLDDFMAAFNAHNIPPSP